MKPQDSGLTLHQDAAVQCDRNLVIFAGPGAGKTKTSIVKAQRILADPKRSLIMSTFTVDAAGEIQARLERAFKQQKLPYPASRVKISTFDSLTLNHLRKNNALQGKLLSPSAQTPLLYQLGRECGIDDMDEPLRRFEQWQSTLERGELKLEIQRECGSAAELINAYYEHLKSCKLVDLATIKRTCVRGIASGKLPLLYASAEMPLTDLIIDEAQDSDELQLLLAITHATNNVTTTLVGDDDQTIYEWRSACGYKGMAQFIKEADAEVVCLNDNFRSHNEVVHHSARLIAFNNPDRVDKNQQSRKGPGGSVLSIGCTDLSAQCNWVANDIADFQDSGRKASVAILSRTNFALDFAEKSLAEFGILKKRVGTSIWERPDLSAFIALIRFFNMRKPDELQNTLGFLQTPSECLRTVGEQLSINPDAFHKPSPDMLAIESWCDSPAHTAIIRSMINLCRTFGNNQAEININLPNVETAFWEWAMLVWPPRSKQADSDGQITESLPAKHKMLRKLTSMAVDVLLKLKGSLTDRLQNLDRLTKQKQEADDAVVLLMTMHGSKGLEWDRVYLINCSETERDTSLSTAGAERRVLYVGMTRARKDLRITYSGPMPLFIKEAKTENLFSTIASE